jgi:hypothetical protein
VAAVLLGYWVLGHGEYLGDQPIPVRAAAVALAALMGLFGARAFLSDFLRSPAVFAGFFLLPSLALIALYYFMMLPQREGTGVRGEQILSALITDASSNGFVEIGFSNPIYTPTLEIENLELYTRDVEAYLRVTDAAGETSLYRAVRGEIPGSALSVEASVRGLLSETEGYLYNPIRVAPLSTRVGRLVFVISTADDGRSFSQSLKDAQSAQFELRVPVSGDLLDVIPLIAL